MDQYRPAALGFETETLSRRITPIEWKEALDAARAAGLRRLDPDRSRS